MRVGAGFSSLSFQDERADCRSLTRLSVSTDSGKAKALLLTGEGPLTPHALRLTPVFHRLRWVEESSFCDSRYFTTVRRATSIPRSLSMSAICWSERGFEGSS